MRLPVSEKGKQKPMRDVSVPRLIQGEEVKWSISFVRCREGLRCSHPLPPHGQYGREEIFAIDGSHSSVRLELLPCGMWLSAEQI